MEQSGVRQSCTHLLLYCFLTLTKRLGTFPEIDFARALAASDGGSALALALPVAVRRLERP